MPVLASRWARWTRHKLLVWISHRRDSAVDEIEEVAPGRDAGFRLSVEAGLMDYWATFARRGSGKISTPGRVLAACRLLECAEKSDKITADEDGMFLSRVARKLWEPHKPGRAPVPLHTIEEVYRLASAIQDNPKSHYAPKEPGVYVKEVSVGTEDRARRKILDTCGITVKKSSEVSSLFKAAIRFARKDLADRQSTKAPESLDEKPIRRADGRVLHSAVSMRPSALASEEHKRRTQNVETWARRGNPHMYK